MRQLRSLVPTLLRAHIRSYRAEHGYSQEHMAELLHISPRSYIDQEHGKFGFSATTVIVYFLIISEQEVLCFLRLCRAHFARIDAP